MNMKKSLKNSGFIKLLNYGGNSLFRGGVFRVDGKYPYEKKVDFMIFINTVDIKIERKFGLVVTSGYKSGSILILLPNECLCGDGGISKEWILENWNKWIYDCNIEKVLFSENYIII